MTDIQLPSEGSRWSQLSDWAARLLDQDYGIAGRLRPLPGEHDLNFHVFDDDTPTHILKVMRPHFPAAEIQMQAEALTRVAETDATVPVPKITTTVDGALYLVRSDPTGVERIVWVLEHLPGRLYCDVRPRLPYLIEELGRSTARLDRALSSFEHPALMRPLKWDLRRAGWIRPHLESIEGDARRHLVTVILDSFEDAHHRVLSNLPAFAIHNDVNDHNVLVDRRAPLALRIGGLIDFGDMIKAPQVCDLAIAGAYVLFGQARPFDALSALVRGYHAQRPLSDVELSLIYPLILTRLAVSVTNAAVTKREKPDDSYVTVSEAGPFSKPSGGHILNGSRRACESPLDDRLRPTPRMSGPSSRRFAVRSRRSSRPTSMPRRLSI